MKKIISVISLVLVLALSFTACGGKKDYKENSKEFKFDRLEIDLTESFSEARRVKANEDSVTIGDLVTYTSKTFTSVTIQREQAQAAFILAADSLKALKATKFEKTSLTYVDEDASKTEKTESGLDYYYYIYTVKESGTEYTFLKAFFNNGEYSYSITFSATKAAYDGSKNDDGYKKHFVDWLKTVSITLPESSEGN